MPQAPHAPSSLHPFARWTALAVASVTLLWLSGCGGGDAGGAGASKAAPPKVDMAAVIAERKAQAEAKKREEEQAAARAAEEAAAAAAAEPPSTVESTDFEKGSKLDGGGYLATSIQAGLRGGERMHLMNLQHNLEIHAAANGWPKSHDEFMRLVAEWGMPLPALDERYEYWYNPEDHQLYKRPAGTAAAEAAAASNE